MRNFVIGQKRDQDAVDLARLIIAKNALDTGALDVPAREAAVGVFLGQHRLARIFFWTTFEPFGYHTPMKYHPSEFPAQKTPPR